MRLSLLVLPFLLLFAPMSYAIRHGENVSSSLYPEVFYISKHDSFCTGVLIHPRVVLTVAHCVDEKTSFTIHAPSLKRGLFKNLQIQKFEKVLVKQKKPLHSELTLILLKEAVSGVVPVKMDFNFIWEAGDEALIAGFGLDEYGKSSERKMKQGFIRFTKLINYEDGRMWKFGPGAQNMQACPGDSGGPLFVDNPEGRALTGIVSFISHDSKSIKNLSDENICNEANSSYYIPIHLHKGWIKETLSLWGLNLLIPGV